MSSSSEPQERYNSRPSSSTPTHEEYVSDLRALPFFARNLLANGEILTIYDGDIPVTQIPRPLFLAATTQPLHLRQFPFNDTIFLPPSTGAKAIISLVFYLLTLTSSTESFSLRYTKDLESDLRLLKAARLLGLKTYVQHIHDFYWWRFNNLAFGAFEVDVILQVALDSEDAFVKLVGGKLAKFMRDGAVVDAERLGRFIKSRPMMQCIVGQQERWYQDTKAIKRGGLKVAAGRGQNNSISPQEKSEGDTAEKKAHRKEISLPQCSTKSLKEPQLRKAILEKTRLGSKKAVMTREEAVYYQKVKGRRCPYKVCG